MGEITHFFVSNILVNSRIDHNEQMAELYLQLELHDNWDKTTFRTF